MVTRVRVRRLALRSPDRPSVQEEEEVLVSSRLVSSHLGCRYHFRWFSRRLPGWPRPASSLPPLASHNPGLASLP